MRIQAVFATTVLTLASGPNAMAGLKGSGTALTPELELKVRWPTSAEISPDGSSVLLTLKEASYDDNQWSTQVYLLTLETGELRQLTFAGKSNTDATWSPDGTRIAFSGTRDDLSQIYLLDLAHGGEAKKLTELSTGASGPIFSPDGKTIAFVSSVRPECKDDACNKKKSEEHSKRKVKALAYDDLLYRHWNAWDEGTRSHIFVIRSDASAPPRDLTPGKHHAPTDSLNLGRGYTFADNETIVYTANVDAHPELSTNNDLYSVPVKGGASKLLTTDNKALDADPVASVDGSYIAYVAHARPGFESDRTVLRIIDRRSGARLTRSESFDRAVSEIVWLHDSSGVYFTAYEHGVDAIFTVGRASGDVSPVMTERSAQLLSVSKSGVLAFVASTLDEPPEVFILEKGSSKPKKASRINAALFETLKLGTIDQLEVDNKGTKVHGFIVYPPDFVRGARYPLVIIIHGGPQGASNNMWHPRWNAQLFAARGYVVAMPNFRGSIGYGQKFTDAVSKDWGGGPFEDVMAFTDALAKKPFVDEKWMCAAGASYGGYMIDWIAGHTQRFKCLITHAGVFNLESMWGDTEELWFPEWEFNGTPWASREVYRRYSPHEYIQNAKTPTLVTHGQLDYRVHISQGQQMFQSLKRLGVPARFVYFPDEGHFVSKPQNFAYWYSEMLGWLSRYLR
jgi:dipeptidyl aminopeptidase/acylaminoacyl peptidase